MELLTISLAANETKQFRKAGGYLEIIDSAYPIGISFYTTNGGQNNSIKGGVSGLYLDAEYGAFDITNGAAAQTITLLVCDVNENGGSRRQPGNVRVIDQSADQTQAGSQFIAMNSVVDAAGGQVCGIWAQTKPCIVRSIQYGSNTTGGVALVVGSGRPLTSPTAAPVPVNKLIGGASASSALPVGGKVTGSFPMTATDLAGVQTVGYQAVQANALYRLELKTPLVIPAGKFFGFATAVANASVYFVAEIEE